MNKFTIIAIRIIIVLLIFAIIFVIWEFSKSMAMADEKNDEMFDCMKDCMTQREECTSVLFNSGYDCVVPSYVKDHMKYECWESCKE